MVMVDSSGGKETELLESEPGEVLADVCAWRAGKALAFAACTSNWAGVSEGWEFVDGLTTGSEVCSVVASVL